MVKDWIRRSEECGSIYIYIIDIDVASNTNITATVFVFKYVLIFFKKKHYNQSVSNTISIQKIK
jgi:hypothetical protein